MGQGAIIHSWFEAKSSVNGQKGGLFSNMGMVESYVKLAS